MVRTLWVSLFLILFVQIAHAEKSEVDYWNETSMDIGVLKKFINNDICYRNQKLFAACVVALNTYANASEENMALYTHDYRLAHTDLVGEIKKSYGGLVLANTNDISSSKKELTVRQQAMLDKLNRESYFESLKSFYASSPRTDFSGILTDLSLKVKNRNEEKYHLGQAYNEFIQMFFDPHSGIMPTAAFEQTMKPEMNFGGLGLEVGQGEGGVLINGFLENSSGREAGLQEGDLIVRVEDQDVTKMPLDKSVALLKGTENTKVKILVQRDTQQIEVEAVRRQVNIKTVQARIVHHLERTFAYVKVTQFTSKVCSNISENIKLLNARSEAKISGIILDLRGDPGGLLGEGSCVGKLFVGKEKTIVTVREFNGQVQPPEEIEFPKATAEEYEALKNLPMVVLINQGSASASEIVAGALQDYKRAWLVGERSFGKGTVQGVFPTNKFPQIGNAFGVQGEFSIKLTTARFYLPSNTSNQMIGITPEFTVPFKPGATEDERFFPREEDRYINAFSSVTEKRVNLRPDETAKILGCAKEERAEKVYAQLKASHKIADYQLLKAQEILDCSIGLRL